MKNNSIPYQRNLILFIVLECFWAVGTWLPGFSTVQPNFLMKLGAGPAVIGLLPTLWALGLGIGALSVGLIGVHRRRIASFMGWVHLAAVLPYLGLSALAFAAGRWDLTGGPGLVIALALLMSFNLMIAPMVQMYYVLISRTLPEDKRARFMGLFFSISTLTALISPFAASLFFREETGSFAVYGWIYLIAFVLLFIGNIPFFFFQEDEVQPLPKRTLRRNLRELLIAWRGNALMRRYLLARAWLAGGFMLTTFMATYSRIEAGLGERTITRYGILFVLVQGTGNFLFGWLADRWNRGSVRLLGGYLNAWFLIQCIGLAALLFAVLGPAGASVVVLTVGGAVLGSGELVIQQNVVMEMGDRRRRMDLLAVGAVVMMPVMVFLPPLCGRLIDQFGHRWVFAGGVLAGLVGLRELWKIKTELFRDRGRV